MEDKFESEKRTQDPVNYNSPNNMSSEWQYSSANLANSSMGLIPTGPKGDLMESSSCSSASMVDSFCPTIWDQSTNSQNLGFCDINPQNNATSTSSTLGFRKAILGSSRTGLDGALDMGWTPPNSVFKGGMLLPSTTSRMLHPNLSQFPADSGFIERAARFSCFNGGNFGDIMNTFSIPVSVGPYSRGIEPMQEREEVFPGGLLKSLSGSKDVTEGSPLNNKRKSESLVRPHDEAKQGIAGSSNESDEAEYSGSAGAGAGREEPSNLERNGGETSAEGHGSKKRRRSGQETELDQVKGVSQLPAEAENDSTGIDQKLDQNPTSTANKPGGKHGKQGSQALDSVKGQYIHVRARRGQATNSHSLAERVRREKISERMKFLQDLVPGCSKVTGKAVMLDEIINYVQSLQRQVEFLSMKLATVNPRLDVNIEGLLAKDILQSLAGTSSSLGFPPELTMPYTPLHPSPPGLVQAGFLGLGNTSEALRRTINSQLAPMSGGFKESTSQVPNVWDDELHNIVQMGFNSSAPLSSQDISGSIPTSHLKVEP